MPSYFLPRRLFNCHVTAFQYLFNYHVTAFEYLFNGGKNKTVLAAFALGPDRGSHGGILDFIVNQAHLLPMVSTLEKIPFPPVHEYEFTFMVL